MKQVKLNNVLIDADQVLEALNLLTLQPEPHRLELTILDDLGDRHYTINAQGNITDLGRNEGNHWLIAELHAKSCDDSYPDAIAYLGDRRVCLYTLESWEVQALGYGDRLTIAVYTDDQGFVGYYYDEQKAAAEFANYIESQNTDDPDSDPDDD